VKRLLLLVLLPLGFVFATPASASACDQPAGPLGEDLRGARVVFTGEITKVSAKSGQNAFTVEVTRTYKGRVPATSTVYSPATVASCGLPRAKVGQEWLFVSSTKGVDVVTRSYEGSARLTDALTTRVQGVLGEGTPASGSTDEEPTAADVELTRVNADDAVDFWPLALPGVVLAVGGLVLVAAARALGRPKAA
jgi:hypothetical protein